MLVPDYVSNYAELNGVVYAGKVKSPTDMIADLLTKKEFSDRMKSDTFNDGAAACACNPVEEVTCVIVFGLDVGPNTSGQPVEGMNAVSS